MTRRNFVPALAAGAGALAAQSSTPSAHAVRHSRIRQGVCGSVFPRGRSLEDNLRDAARFGAVGYDLLGGQDFPLAKKYGLVSTMLFGFGGDIANGLNRTENHERLEKLLHEGIDLCAANGAPNVITFSGNRRGMSDAQGMDNCVAILNRIKRHAEDKGVTICMELLNSKVDHKDYMCDHAEWGVETCRRVNSPRVKLLYDIYHMQIMDGDIVRTIRNNIQWIGHFHTGGVPGRHDIDQTQELNYAFIAKAIADTGYAGYVSHEYSPANPADWGKALDTAMRLFEV